MGPTDLSAAAYAPPRHDSLLDPFPFRPLQGDASLTNAPPLLWGEEAFPQGDFFGHDGLAKLLEAFDAITYRIPGKPSPGAERQTPEAGPKNDSAGAQIEQLHFEFYAAARYEELVTFQQRVETVANGVDGVRRESLVQVSRQVSARFEFSMTVSGEALRGFAGAAEGAKPPTPYCVSRYRENSS